MHLKGQTEQPTYPPSLSFSICKAGIIIPPTVSCANVLRSRVCETLIECNFIRMTVLLSALMILPLSPESLLRS